MPLSAGFWHRQLDREATKKGGGNTAEVRGVSHGLRTPEGAKGGLESWLTNQ